MALNRKKPPVEIPAPSASSSSEAEDSSEEEQQEQMTRTTPALKPQQQEEEDVDDEDDDEEESDESENAAAAAATVTPSSQKPQSESEEEEEEDEESDSVDDGKAIKLSDSDFAVKVNKSPEPSTKRAAENAGSSKNNKKAKVVSDGDGNIAGSSAVDDSKKSFFNRVWSENDEIMLLEGFHAYITKNGSDSITNLSVFYDTIKDLDLSLDVTRTRLYEKLRGLKNKYLKNVRREQKVFSHPHEEKLYKISEKIWGGEVGVIEESRKKNKKAGKRFVEKKDICKLEEPGSSFPLLAASLEFEASTYLPMTAVDPKEFAKNMVLKFEKKKAKELEEEWKEYSLMESQLYAKRVKIMRKQADVLLDVLKRSNLN